LLPRRQPPTPSHTWTTPARWPACRFPRHRLEGARAVGRRARTCRSTLMIDAPGHRTPSGKAHVDGSAPTVELVAECGATTSAARPIPSGIRRRRGASCEGPLVQHDAGRFSATGFQGRMLHAVPTGPKLSPTWHWARLAAPRRPEFSSNPEDKIRPHDGHEDNLLDDATSVMYLLPAKRPT
jgi:hypothetical protein